MSRSSDRAERSSRAGTSERRAARSRSIPSSGTTPEPLPLPRIPAVVVAEPLPEAALVVVEQADAAYPLGALPQVQVRHKQARRRAVLRLERAAVEVVGDPG